MSDKFFEVDVGGKKVKLPIDYDPRNDKKSEYMCELHRAYFKKRLLDWLNETKSKLNPEISGVNADRRSVDESDNMTMEENVLSELRMKDRYRKLIRKISEYLVKIDNDVYGFCEKTGDEIGINRLWINPIARYCIEVQEQMDQKERQEEFNERNIEEEDHEGFGYSKKDTDENNGEDD